MTSEPFGTPDAELTDTPPPEGTAETAPLPPPAVPRGTWPKAVPLLVLAGLLAYANSFTKVFLLDDIAWIVGNQDLAAGNVREYVASRGRTIPALSLVLNYRLGGLNPTGYHAFNLAVHVLAGLALYGLVRRTLLLPRFAGRYDDAAPFLAFAVALLWLVHPLTTQAVTYVIQRDESIMGMFYLFAFYAWVRGATGGTGAARLWYAAAVGSFALSCGSKEVAVTLPPVLLIYDRVFLARSWRGLLRDRWAAYLAVLAVWAYFFRPVLAVATSTEGGPGVGIGFALTTATPLQYLFTQSGVILHYLRLSVLPVGQAFDYLDWPIARSFREVWAPFLAVAGLFLTGCVLLAVRPAAGFVVVWFFFILAPTSSVMPIIDPAFEHRMYLPLVAVVAAIVFGGYALARRYAPPGRAPEALAGAALVLAVPLVVLTYARNETYRSHPVAWQTAAKARPNNPRAWGNLAVAYVNLGAQDKVEEAVHRIEACHGPYVEGQANLRRADWLLMAGRVEQAEAAFRKLVDRPFHFYASPGPTRTLARILIARGKPTEAAVLMRKLIENEPRQAENRMILAAAELAAGREAEARSAAEEAVRIDPNSPRTAGTRPRTWVFAEDEPPAWKLYLRPLAVWEIEAACLADGGSDPMLLDTLALWHARLARSVEPGPGWLTWPVRAAHLARAEDAARRGVAAAEAKGDADRAAALRTRAESYKAGRPLTGSY